MARLAIIDDATKKVVNVAETESFEKIKGFTYVFSDVASPGDSYDGDNFIRQKLDNVPVDYKMKAIQALVKKDIVINRCVEKNIPVPTEWSNYADDLRAILESGEGPLPDPPPYPVS